MISMHFIIKLSLKYENRIINYPQQVFFAPLFMNTQFKTWEMYTTQECKKEFTDVSIFLAEKSVFILKLWGSVVGLPGF